LRNRFNRLCCNASKFLREGKGADQSRLKDNRTCTQCGLATALLLDDVLKGEHTCPCGARYRVISATSDASRLCNNEYDVRAILANCNVKVILPSAIQSENQE
jgi:hypothetical protein